MPARLKRWRLALVAVPRWLLKPTHPETSLPPAAQAGSKRTRSHNPTPTKMHLRMRPQILGDTMPPAHVQGPKKHEELDLHHGRAAAGCKGSVEGLMQEACTAQLEMELHVKDQEVQSLKEKLEAVMQQHGADGRLTGHMPAAAFAGLHHPGTITKMARRQVHYEEQVRQARSNATQATADANRLRQDKAELQKRLDASMKALSEAQREAAQAQQAQVSSVEQTRVDVEAEMHRRLQEREGLTYLAQAAASEAQGTIQELSTQLHQAQGGRNQAMGKKVARDQQVHALQQRLEEVASEGVALRRAMDAKQQAVTGLEGRLVAQRKRIMQLERAYESEHNSHGALRSKDDLGALEHVNCEPATLALADSERGFHGRHAWEFQQRSLASQPAAQRPPATRNLFAMPPEHRLWGDCSPTQDTGPALQQLQGTAAAASNSHLPWRLDVYPAETTAQFGCINSDPGLHNPYDVSIVQPAIASEHRTQWDSNVGALATTLHQPVNACHQGSATSLSSAAHAAASMTLGDQLQLAGQGRPQVSTASSSAATQQHFHDPLVASNNLLVSFGHPTGDTLQSEVRPVRSAVKKAASLDEGHGTWTPRGKPNTAGVQLNTNQQGQTSKQDGWTPRRPSHAAGHMSGATQPSLPREDDRLVIGRAAWVPKLRSPPMQARQNVLPPEQANLSAAEQGQAQPSSCKEYHGVDHSIGTCSGDQAFLSKQAAAPADCAQRVDEDLRSQTAHHSTSSQHGQLSRPRASHDQPVASSIAAYGADAFQTQAQARYSGPASGSEYAAFEQSLRAMQDAWDQKADARVEALRNLLPNMTLHSRRQTSRPAQQAAAGANSSWQGSSFNDRARRPDSDPGGSRDWTQETGADRPVAPDSSDTKPASEIQKAAAASAHAEGISMDQGHAASVFLQGPSLALSSVQLRLEQDLHQGHTTSSSGQKAPAEQRWPPESPTVISESCMLPSAIARAQTRGRHST
ncbi:hypothetical protein WJX74_000400 [Apatococcus lobatus]|uniref:Uncharacterized protein n=1 Tax=Apatococcus lobatus TaxID=904363 RepID=A0AAW1RJ80_9CHLO